LNKKTITYSGYKIHPVYKSYKRYKTGKSLNSVRKIKTSIELQATVKELKLNKIKGFCYLLIFLIIYVIPIMLFYFSGIDCRKMFMALSKFAFKLQK